MYIGQSRLSPLESKACWDLIPFSQLPSAALTYFPESHLQPEISSLSKEILVLGKARSGRTPNLGCRGPESPGWFDVLPEKLCTRHNAWAVVLWWSCQSPVFRGFGLRNHPNSFCGGMFKLNVKFDADSCSACSVILNAMAIQCTYSHNSIYHPTD